MDEHEARGPRRPVDEVAAPGAPDRPPGPDRPGRAVPRREWIPAAVSVVLLLGLVALLLFTR